MPTIYQQREFKFDVISGETKTAFPESRHLPAGLEEDDIEPGELVGLSPRPGERLEVQKITASNEVDQAANAAMRLDNTRYDTLESGAITVLQGLYVLSTQMYDAGGSYSQGDLLTAQYDSDVDGGVFAPVNDGTTNWAIGQVQSPPQNAAQNTPMRIQVFTAPQDVSFRS